MGGNGVSGGGRRYSLDDSSIRSNRNSDAGNQRPGHQATAPSSDSLEDSLSLEGQAAFSASAARPSAETVNDDPNSTMSRRRRVTVMGADHMREIRNSPDVEASITNFVGQVHNTSRAPILSRADIAFALENIFNEFGELNREMRGSKAVDKNGNQLPNEDVILRRAKLKLMIQNISRHKTIIAELIADLKKLIARLEDSELSIIARTIKRMLNEGVDVNSTDPYAYSFMSKGEQLEMRFYQRLLNEFQEEMHIRFDQLLGLASDERDLNRQANDANSVGLDDDDNINIKA